VSTTASVRLWGTQIGAVSLEDGRTVATFEYDPEFLASGIQVSPISMALRREPYSFPGLNLRSFHGLPGLLADSLPDRFGNALIDVWLASQGRLPEQFNAVERLCYTSTRGMGALEFRPAGGPRPSPRRDIEIGALVALASEVLANREDFKTSLARGAHEQALMDILSVGTSAGGARAKAVIAYDERTGEVRSGQVEAAPGFAHWLLKFDGVSGNKDKELDDPKGFGAIEFAYSLMAAQAGVAMTECRLLEENGRRHFMTRRFDRVEGPRGVDKLHMQSLGAIAHYDFNTAGANSYEQALGAMRRLGLTRAEVEQQFRRMVFNVVARNQDDHVKNIAFLMDRGGRWTLSPAFDVTYAYAPGGEWTSRHQMSINGKRDGLSLEDVRSCARTASLSWSRGAQIVDEVRGAVAQWASIAASVHVDEQDSARIARAHRLDLPRA
jgi:serine/threonine-protein kinase HipA